MVSHVAVIIERQYRIPVIEMKNPELVNVVLKKAWRKQAIMS